MIQGLQKQFSAGSSPRLGNLAQKGKRGGGRISFLRNVKSPRGSLNSDSNVSHSRLKVNEAYAFSRSELIKDILRNARSAGIPSGSAEIFAERTADHVEDWMRHRTIVTQADIDRIISQKLSTFNPDLAFFYKNNDKII